MIVWGEIPVVDNITETTAFYDNAKQMLTELIRQNYNRPSIMFWSIANEVKLHAGPDPNALLTQLNTLAKTEDPTRLTTLGTAGDDVTDPTVLHTDLLGVNVYYGWYYGVIGDFATHEDNAHATAPSLKLSVSEYGAGSSINFHSDAPAAQDHSEEDQNLFHEGHLAAMKTRAYLWGKFVWNMFDL